MRGGGERLADWSRDVRRSTLKRLARVPHARAGWRPAPGALSFADLVHHLIAADRWLERKLTEPELGAMVAAAGEGGTPDAAGFARLVAELEASGERRARLLAGLDDAALARRLDDERFGGEVSVWWMVVRGTLEHEAHHRGQLAAALRLLESR